MWRLAPLRASKTVAELSKIRISSNVVANLRVRLTLSDGFLTFKITHSIASSERVLIKICSLSPLQLRLAIVPVKRPVLAPSARLTESKIVATEIDLGSSLSFVRLISCQVVVLLIRSSHLWSGETVARVVVAGTDKTDSFSRFKRKRRG